MLLLLPLSRGYIKAVSCLSLGHNDFGGFTLTGIMIVATEPYSGKTTILLGLALELISRGYKVGYMKPVGTLPVNTESGKVDADALFAKQILSLEDETSDITPIYLTAESLSRYMRKRPKNIVVRVSGSYVRIREGKDFVLIEGGQNLTHGKLIGLSAPELANILDAHVLLLETYAEEVTVDRILFARVVFGERLLGVVINWIPENRMKYVRNNLTRFLSGEGIETIGLMGIDDVLRSISIGDLAQALSGEIICAKERARELVQNMMVGAMGKEQALKLFRSRSDKVVITGGDRTDIQLAALETPTKCLILTGGHKPPSSVVAQAEELGVPIILVQCDTASAVEIVDEAISKQKGNNETKISRMRGIIRDEIDFGFIEKAHFS